MALINCPNCNGTVSTKASACPHCGTAPIAQLTKKERIQKLADELGSMSAAINAMENGIEPSNAPPTKSSINETPKSNTMTAAAWAAVIIVLVRLWMFADRAWTNHSKAVEAEKHGQKGEKAAKYIEDINAQLQEQQRSEAIRKQLNPDIRELMKTPGNHVGQPNSNSSN